MALPSKVLKTRRRSYKLPLVFSPLSEAILQQSILTLMPKKCFVLRQLGEPSELDLKIFEQAQIEFLRNGYSSIDANHSNSAKDYLARILSLIRSTSFTVAIFTHETRPTALANIFLELGFAAICGKPIVIIKDHEADAPSDIKRTDWIDYNNSNPREFSSNIGKATNQMALLGEWELDLLLSSQDAPAIDLEVALERARKGFLISKDPTFIEVLQRIMDKIEGTEKNQTISDLRRISEEVGVFVRQAKRCLELG